MLVSGILRYSLHSQLMVLFSLECHMLTTALESQGAYRNRTQSCCRIHVIAMGWSLHLKRELQWEKKQLQSRIWTSPLTLFPFAGAWSRNCSNRRRVWSYSWNYHLLVSEYLAKTRQNAQDTVQWMQNLVSAVGLGILLFKKNPQLSILRKWCHTILFLWEI